MRRSEQDNHRSGFEGVKQSRNWPAVASRRWNSYSFRLTNADAGAHIDPNQLQFTDSLGGTRASLLLIIARLVAGGRIRSVRRREFIRRADATEATGRRI